MDLARLRITRGTAGVALGLLIAAAAFVLLPQRHEQTPGGAVPRTPVALAGSATCATCHPDEYKAWLGSNHRHAMEPATAAAVLGDFGGVDVEYYGRTTRFFTEGDRFRITIEDESGTPRTYTIAYTLGYRPLQQYLVETEGGRLQALPFAWDTRERAEGGQRWFHLYPDENVTPDSPLFWTRPLQNWNHMCAECHTTAFAKGFDREAGTFASTWAETGNGCESCHGAGSTHVAAKQPGRVSEDTDGALRTLGSFNEQIDQCGFCHARRVRLRDPEPPHALHEAMLETWRPQLPTEGLYFVDGQIRDEVFEIGSYLQSRMAAAEVRCSDCHDPHTSRLRAEGNALCTSCHAPERFDVERHHFHTPGTAAAQCVTCHMPVRTYMVVDDRRDHRLAVPTPHLSDQLGTPNPCVTCHKDRSNAWAAAAIARNRQPDATPRDDALTLGTTAWSIARERTDAAERLRRFVSHPSVAPIARAAALATIRAASPAMLGTLDEALRSPLPIVRLGAVQAAGGVPPPQRLTMLAGLLRDPSRAVRLDAAGQLAGAGEQAPPDVQSDLRAALDEHRRWLAGDADRAEALAGLANLQALAGDVGGARASYEEAVQRDALSLVALLNYADYHRALGDDATVDQVLARAITHYPDAAPVHYAQGLLRVRQKRYTEAVPALARAVQLAPHDSGYAYVHGVALYSTGQTAAAMSALVKARDDFPGNPQIRDAIEAYCSELQGRGAGAGPRADRAAIEQACGTARN